MTRRLERTSLRGLLAALCLVATATALAALPGQAESQQAAVRRHVRALEGAAAGPADDVLARLERDHFAPGFLERTTPAERRALVDALRAAAADAGGVTVEARNGRFELILSGARTHTVTFTLAPEAPFGIETLDVDSSGQPQTSTGGGDRPALTAESLPATFDRLEREAGWSGVVFVTLDGETVLERAFGQANAELGVPVSLDTVFGTGSRPIDYTIAAIGLLAQQGRLSLDDTIDRHFEHVPADKQSMTIRHLINGESGLPDFFHTDDDWDADLAWIDRATAEVRLLEQPLLFAPGTDRRHSHGAFGLLAAIIERRSGQSYGAFLREHFFEPAGMTRTGFYGESLDLSLRDFAVGGGPGLVGVPNIPPNWGPTSWLIMGSGGMYSTLRDLQRFYAFIRAGDVLDDRHAARFRGPFGTVDGSDRGFELFHAYNPPGHEAILMVNMPGRRSDVRDMFRALQRLVDPRLGG